MRRVAIYTRRSTDEDNQPFSIDAQRAGLHRHVDARDDATIVAEYTDDASGATLNRPGLQNALHAARAGRFDVLLVYRLDRLSRRQRDLLKLLADLDEVGVAFESATESIDTSSAVGKLNIQMLGMFAEFERNTIIDRVKAGTAAKAAKGRWVGGRTPYGYTTDPATQKLTPQPDEAPVLQEIFRLYTRSRLGTRAIADALNQRGLTTRAGKPWSGVIIGRMLDNPAYVGDIAYRDVYVPDAHPALIDRDIFAKAQTVAAARTDRTTHRAMSDSDYYLTGLIACPECGHRYIGTAATGKTRRYRYYTCYHRIRYGPKGCQARRLPADVLDQLVLQALADFYANADTLLAAAIERAHTQHHADALQHRRELDATTAQIRTKNVAIDKYLTAFETGTLDDTTAGTRLRALRNEIEQLRARHAELEDQLNNVPTAPPPGTIDRLRQHLTTVINSGSHAERKATIEALVAEIKITNEGVIPVFRIPNQPPTGAPATTSGNTDPRQVRAMKPSVGLRGLEPLTHTARRRQRLCATASRVPRRPGDDDQR
jgi:site-specific DNA recombinase